MRAFELPEGFFPVHVFVPLMPEGGVAAALAAFVAAACGSAPRGDLRPCAPVATTGGAAPMHLSLSRTLPVCRAKLGSLTVRRTPALFAHFPHSARVPRAGRAACCAEARAASCVAAAARAVRAGERRAHAHVPVCGGDRGVCAAAARRLPRRCGGG